MNYLTTLTRIAVGILFIISGIVKLIDPVGFSIKLGEYFTEVLPMAFIEPYALGLAVIVVCLEILLGVLLLLGFKIRLTLWGLFLMTLFFTLLTGYIYLTGFIPPEVGFFNLSEWVPFNENYLILKDCGCFGDAVKMSALDTFLKDVLLLGLIGILFWGHDYLKPIFSFKVTSVLSFLVLSMSLFAANHTINHLPIVDFRPFHVGANIPEGMAIPEDAPQDEVEYSWTFMIDGKEKKYKTNGSYPDVPGDFVGVATKTLKKGYEPPIHDFSIEKDGEDFTEDMMALEKLLIVVAYDLDNTDKDAYAPLSVITKLARSRGYTVIGMTASGQDVQEKVKTEYNLDFDFYFCDATTLKTMVRANPGILKLSQGTIVQKVHWHDWDALEVESLK